LVCAKSPLFAPVIPSEVRLRVAVPLLVIVKLCGLVVMPKGVEAKVIEPGLNWIPGTPVPVPEVETLCGLVAALSVMTMVPARGPTAVGVKVTTIVQLPPAAIGEPVVQFCVSPKLLVAGLKPTAEMVSGALPVFVTVTFCVLLVVPTF